jgi:hypothetical protein
MTARWYSAPLYPEIGVAFHRRGISIHLLWRYLYIGLDDQHLANREEE